MAISAPIAIFLAGANGAGKSTLRDQIQQRFPSHTFTVIDPDQIARSINPTDPRRADVTAGKLAIHQFQTALDAQQSVSLETTLTGNSILKRMQAARDAGYIVELHYVGLGDPNAHVARVIARTQAGGHFIDPQTIRQRYKRSIEAVPTAVAIANRTSIIDNAGDRPIEMLYIENGQISEQHQPLPAWVQQLMPAILSQLGKAQPGNQPP